MILHLLIHLLRKIRVQRHPDSIDELALSHFSLVLDLLHILLQLLMLLLLKLDLHLKKLLVLGEHLGCHLLTLVFCSHLLLLLVDLLRKMRELVGHSHAVVAVYVASVPNDVMWVWEPIIDWLLLLELLLLLLKLLLHLLLLCQLVLEDLVIFSSVLLYLCLSLLVKISLYRVLLRKPLVCFRELSALVNDDFNLVQVCSQVFRSMLRFSPS